MAKQYTTNTFSLEDLKRFNKWKSENPDYNFEAGPVSGIFTVEATAVDIMPEVYKGLNGGKGLKANSQYSVGDLSVTPTELDVQAYYAKYPHHDEKLSEEKYQQYIQELQKPGGTTLDIDEKQQEEEAKELPADSPPAPISGIGDKPQTKDAKSKVGDPDSGHFHFIEVDEDGNGKTISTQITLNVEQNIQYAHAHKIENWTTTVVNKGAGNTEVEPHTHELWTKTLGKDFDPQGVQNHKPIDSKGKEEETPAQKEPLYKIVVKLASYPGEPVDYVFKVFVKETGSLKVTKFIPSSQKTDYSEEELNDEAFVKRLGIAYLKSLFEEFPNYDLDDQAGIMPVISEVTEPAEDTPADEKDIEEDIEEETGKKPVKEIVFPDARYSELLQVGTSHINSKSPFDIKTAMGYILYSDKMIRDHESGDFDWMKLLSKYTFPTVTIKPSAKTEADTKDLDSKSAKTQSEITEENAQLNDSQAKLDAYNKRKNVSIFAGDTLFGNMEGAVQKMRGPGLSVETVFGEVIHQINLRTFLMKAMACLVEKMNPGDIAEALCKSLIKAAMDELGFEKVKEILQEINQALGKGDKTFTEDFKKKLDEADKRIKNKYQDTGIDGKDPFSSQARRVSKEHLRKNKEHAKIQKQEMDRFVEDIKNFVDLNALCERLGKFVNNVPKLLFAPGGLAKIRQFEILPKLPWEHLPLLELPKFNTEDIMKDVLKAIERAIKQLIVESIVGLIRGVMEEVMRMCEDIDSNISKVNPQNILNTPTLPDRHGAASPLNSDINKDNAPELLTGLGIPPERARDIVDMLDGLSDFLKPSELCKLLSGDASLALLRKVLVRIQEEFPKLSLYINDRGDVSKLFKKLGESVDQTFCGSIVTSISSIVDMCEDVADDSLHEGALRKKGFSEDQIKKILENDALQKKDALEKMSDMFINPDSMVDTPPTFCSPTSPGMVSGIPEAIEHNIDRYMDTIFEHMETSYRFEVESVKPAMVHIISKDVEGAAPLPFEEGKDYPVGATIEINEEDGTATITSDPEQPVIERKFPQAPSREVVPSLKANLESGLLDANLMTSKLTSRKDNKFTDEKKYNNRTVIKFLGNNSGVSASDVDALAKQLKDIPGDVDVIGAIKKNVNFDVVSLDLKTAEENIINLENSEEVDIKNVATIKTNKKKFFNPLEDEEIKTITSKYEVEEEIDPQVKELIIDLLSEDYPDQGIKESLSTQGVLNSSLQSIIFSKLVSRNIKKDLIPLVSEANSGLESWKGIMTLYMSQFEDPLRELYERYLMIASAESVFKKAAESSLLKVENFDLIELIPPEDPEILSINDCVAPNSSGQLQSDGLLSFSKLKVETKDIIKLKYCLNNDDDEDAIASSMKAAAALTIVRLGLIESVLNSIFILTQVDIVAALTDEKYLKQFLYDFDNKLKNDGFEFRKLFYEILVSYLSDKLEQNIELDGITEDTLNSKTALKYICKKSLIDLSSEVEILLKETPPDPDMDWGFNTFMNLHVPINKLVDAPGAMINTAYDGYGNTDNSAPLTGISNLLGSHKIVPGVDLPMKMVFEKEEQHGNPNIMKNDYVWRDPAAGEDIPGIYTNAIYSSFDFSASSLMTKKISSVPSLMTKKLSSDGGFFLQKYARIEYVSPTAMSSPHQIFTWLDHADDPNNDYKHEIVAIDELERALYTKALDLPVNDYKSDDFVTVENSEFIKDHIKIHFGIRLMYALPSFGNSRGTQIESKRHEAVKKYETLLESIQGFNQEGLYEKEFSKAAYNLRSAPVTVPASLLNIEIPNEDTPTSPDSTGGMNWSQLLSSAEFSYVYDINTIPIVSVERPLEHHPQTFKTPGLGLSEFNSTTFESLRDFLRGTSYAADGGYDSSDYEEAIVDRFYKDGSTVKKSFGYFDSQFENHPDGKEGLMEDLKNTPEYKLIKDYIFPMKTTAGAAAQYINLYPKSNTIDMDNIFIQTRSSLASLIDVLNNNDDYRYSPDTSSQKRASSMVSTNMSPIPNLAALAAKTVPTIIKGMAETMDPAFGMATFIQTAAGLPPHLVPHLTVALLPPPMFPPVFPTQIFPITPLGMTAVALSMLDPFGELLKKKHNSKTKKKDCLDDDLEDEE